MSDVQAKKMWLPEAMGLMQDLRVENEALQARIDELEKANKDKLKKILKHENSYRQIKAEGIREMLNAFDETLTPENDISCYSLEDFADEYADKLEKGDEN